MTHLNNAERFSRAREIAEQLVETLFNDGLELPEFVEALAREIRAEAGMVRRNRRDYEPEDARWYEQAERDVARLASEPLAPEVEA